MLTVSVQAALFSVAYTIGMIATILSLQQWNVDKNGIDFGTNSSTYFGVTGKQVFRNVLHLVIQQSETLDLLAAGLCGLGGLHWLHFHHPDWLRWSLLCEHMQSSELTSL